MKLMLEALIIRSGNSQNTNFTDSYASETTCIMEGVELVGIIKEGYKRYDANEILLEEIPDEPVAQEAYADLYKSFQGAYLAEFTKEDEEYALIFELADDDAVTDSYEVSLKVTDVTFTWDKYMNRVQY